MDHRFYVPLGKPLNQVEIILGSDFLAAYQVGIKYSSQGPQVRIGEDEVAVDEGVSSLNALYAHLRESGTFLAVVQRLPEGFGSVSGEMMVDLTPEEKQQLEELLIEFKDIFEPHQEPPKERVPGESARIRLRPNAVAKSIAAYPMSAAARAAGKQIITDLLARKFLVEGSSDWGSPLLVVAKVDQQGKVYGHRPCWDFRHLNSQVVRNHFPLPLIEDCLSRLAAYSIYCGTDGDDGFGQLPLEKESQSKACVTTPWGTFLWRVLPQGLANGPSDFQSLVNRVFKDYHEWLINYVDDFALGASTKPQMFLRLRLFFTRCRKENIRLKKSKSFFFQRIINFLGHRISHRCVAPLEKHVIAIQDWPLPRTAGQVSSFLGLCNYYRKFLKDYAHVCGPLNKFTATSKQSSKTKVTLSTEAVESFRKLKSAFTTSSVLASWDRSRPHRLRTDANYDIGCGAVLEQWTLPKDSNSEDEGAWKPVFFYSKRFAPAELRYTVQEKEMLSLVQALKAYQHLLIGESFVVETDNSAVACYLTKHPDKLTHREGRWLEFISRFTPFTLKHLAGTENVVADLLSRETSEVSGSDFSIVDLYAGSPTLLRAIGQWYEDEGKDAKVRSIEYQAVEIDEASRQALEKVHQSLLRKGVPLTPDPFRLSRHVDHDCQKISQKFWLHRQFLQQADLVVAGPPCQPWSKASRGAAAGANDDRDGFPTVMRLKTEGCLGTYHIVETVPTDLPLDARLEEVLGVSQTVYCGAQTRKRILYSNLSLPQEPHRPTWQECLDAAKQGSTAPRERSPTLCASRNTHSSRSKASWVTGSDGVLRELTIEERECLCGLQPGDTLGSSTTSLTQRWRMTGNAIPSSTQHHWVRIAFERRLSPAEKLSEQTQIKANRYVWTGPTERVSESLPRRLVSDKPPEPPLPIKLVSEMEAKGLLQELLSRGLISRLEERDDLWFSKPVVAEAGVTYPLSLSEPEQLKASGILNLLSKTELLEKVSSFHAKEAGHSGVQRTYKILLEHHPDWLDGVPREEIYPLVSEVVRTCTHCQKYKASRFRKGKIHVLPFPRKAEPFAHVQIDDSVGWPLTEEAHNGFLVIADVYSGYIYALPIHNKDDRVRRCKLLHTFFSAFGFPERLYVDQGSHYCNALVQQYKDLYGISLCLGSPEHHSTQGVAERAVELVRQSIFASLDVLQKETNVATSADWELVLPDALRFLNSRPRPDFQDLSPNEIVFGRSIKPYNALDLAAKWNSWHAAVKEIRETAHAKKVAKAELTNREQQLSDPVYNVGDQVGIRVPLRHRKKDQPHKFDGPYQVVKVLGHGNYRMSDGATKSITMDRHWVDLKIWHSPSMPTTVVPPRRSERRSVRQKLVQVAHYVYFYKSDQAKTKSSGAAYDASNYKVSTLTQDGQQEEITWSDDLCDHACAYLKEWKAVARSQADIPPALQSLWGNQIIQYKAHGIPNRNKVNRLCRQNRDAEFAHILQRKFGIAPALQGDAST